MGGGRRRSKEARGRGRGEDRGEKQEAGRKKKGGRGRGVTEMVRLRRRRSRWKEVKTEGMPTPPLAPMETVRQCGATIVDPLYGASSPWVVPRRTSYQASSRIHRDDRPR